jgi:hypothetical protein
MSQATSPDLNKERESWVHSVESLCRQVADWAARKKWTVTWQSHHLTEELLGSYDVPSLTVQTDHGIVTLKPIAREVMGATGRVDLSAYPTLFRVMLLRSPKDGQWRIRTDSGVYIKQPWSESTFLDLVADLTGADEP